VSICVGGGVDSVRVRMCVGVGVGVGAGVSDTLVLVLVFVLLSVYVLELVCCRWRARWCCRWRARWCCRTTGLIAGVGCVDVQLVLLCWLCWSR